MDLLYGGNELDVFAQAQCWKTHRSELIRPFVLGDVLDVGGGVGGNVSFLVNDKLKSLTVLEPDPRLFDRLQRQCHCTMVRLG